MITGTTSLAQLATARPAAATRGDGMPLNTEDGLTTGGMVAVGFGATIGTAVGLGFGSFAAFGLALGGSAPWKSSAAAIAGGVIGAALLGAGTYGLVRLAD